MKLAVLAYIFLMPFMSALAPTSWLPLPLIFLIAMTPLVFVSSTNLTFGYISRRDFGFWIMLMCGLVGITLSPIPAGPKNLNYSVATVTCYCFFFCTARGMVCSPRVQWSDIGRACQICLTFLSCAVIVEFYLASFQGIFFADVIHFAHDDLNAADFISDDFKRPRAFATEPGFTALAYESLWPLSLLASRQRKWQHALFAVAFTLLASAAAVVCLISAGIVFWLTKSRDIRSFLKVTTVLALLSSVLIANEVAQNAAWMLFGRKLDVASIGQISGSDDKVTVIDRLSTYDVGATLISQHPMGIGWGTLGQAFADRMVLPDVGVLNGSGMINLYLDIAVAGGILGLLGWLIFLGARIYAVLALKHPHAGKVSIALLSVAFHHFLITEMQFPFVWLSLALADRIAIESTNGFRADSNTHRAH